MGIFHETLAFPKRIPAYTMTDFFVFLVICLTSASSVDVYDGSTINQGPNNFMTINGVHYICPGLTIRNGQVVGEHKTIKCKDGNTLITTKKEEKSEDELCKEVAVKLQKAKVVEANARKVASRARKVAKEAVVNARIVQENARKIEENALHYNYYSRK